jgi:hypothetical protein
MRGERDTGGIEQLDELDEPATATRPAARSQLL